MAEGKGHTELLPCPFCGGEPRPIRKHKNANGKSLYTIGCGNYCCVTKKDTIEKTKASWNTRAAVNTYPAVEGLVKALEGARQFITNGIELGYIRMPDSDTPDPAHQRLPQIEAALSRFRSLQNGGAYD